MPGIDQAHRIARERFGFERLRAGQVEAIEELLAGRDVLAVMPTGSGKSAVYQIAGVLTPGATLVVSPLIALQRDQVESIQETGVAEAAEVNASVSERERRDAWEDLADDELEFLFLAPEQLGKEEALERLRAAAPSLVVVDEAHCVSEWGHDFRPDYLRLGAVIEELGRPTVLALTATASPPVRDEILARLGMRAAAVVVAGFDRPNIHLAVERFASEEAKRKALVERVASARKPGIVYAATRRRAEELAEALLEVGLRAAPYHAGVAARERDRVQTAFMDDELDAIVATIAFGMGVDKPNVAFVFHHDVSDSVDSYYQEIGRAGRDGEPAEALLLFRPEDVGLRRFFAGKGQVDADEVERVASAVHRRARPVDPAELPAEVDHAHKQLLSANKPREEVGAV
jgi:ATP-dependent DNA helicase RecQ